MVEADGSDVESDFGLENKWKTRVRISLRGRSARLGGSCRPDVVERAVVLKDD